jgi:hypothetical protein
VVHSTISDRDGTEGEFKVYGSAVAVDDQATRDRYCASLRQATGWAPEGDDWHLWYVAIDQVSWFRAVGEQAHPAYETEVWHPA